MSSVESHQCCDVIRQLLISSRTCVAIVDADGRIDFVNQAWRAFADHAIADSAIAVEGADYLAAFKAFVTTSEEFASRLAEGVREVLNGPHYEVGFSASVLIDRRPERLDCRIAKFGSDASTLVIITHEVASPRDQTTDRHQEESPDWPRRHADELMRLKNSLHENQRRMSESQRIAQIGYWERDLIDGLTDWSDEVYRILDLNKSETPPSQDAFLQRVHPEDRRRVSKAIDVAIARQSRMQLDYRILTPSSEVRHLQDRSEIRTDDQGRSIRIFGTVQDVTEQKRIENQLRDYASADSVRAQMRDADMSQPESVSWKQLINLIAEQFNLLGGGFHRHPDDDGQIARPRDIPCSGPDDAATEAPGPRNIELEDAMDAAFRFGRTFRSEDLTDTLGAASPLESSQESEYRFHLAIPVFVGDRIIGGVMLHSDSSTAFPMERVRHLQDLVNETAEWMCRVRIDKDAASRKEESDQRLLRVIAEMPVLMIAFSADGSIAAWNPECERVTGFPAHEMMGSGEAIDRLFPDKQVRAAFREYWMPGEVDPRDCELSTTCLGGDQRIIAWSRVSDRFAIPGWATWGIGIDVTERKKAKQLLASSARDYRGLFDNAHDAILIFRPADEVVLEANPRACELYQMSRADFIGSSLKDISDDVESGTRRINETLDSGKHIGFETVQYRKDGTAMLLEVNAALIEYQGEPAILTINRDITARRAVEVSLRNSEARYRWLADHSTDMILRISIDGTILDASHASRGLLGFAPDELVGMNCSRLLAAEHLKAFDEILQRARIDAGPHRVAVQFKSPRDGKCWLECLVEALRNSDNADVREIVIVARDVSLRRQEEELRELRSMELAHVNRLVTMGEMAGQIAHQLHQPLTAISNYAGTLRILLQKSGADNLRDLQPYCDEIIRSTMRTAEFIHRIRAFTQRRGLRQTPTQLRTMISNAFSLCEIRLQRLAIHTSYYEATDIPEIVVDTIQIEQVVVNLINNAIDAMTTLEAGHRRLSITAHLEADSQVVVCIRDSGVGIPESSRQQLLQPFFTTKSDGVGMGLIISRRIVEAHGGKLWINSQPNEGTSVFFTLSVGETDDDKQ